ncbi:hypothetical protein CXB51_006283 [Gossypium anomalum]|uniref:Integrase catalytic domain-containing protein n=1 Tax=Gossypium anomalum TaxID=47600 RepID=A0A8J6DCU0_9ROSI|nr:hypothetical protein CXB51_006283 [Gossypium anomalum]
MDDKQWAKINRQACGTIRLCLAKEQKYSVMRETSTKKLWDTLEEKFLTKSLENRLYMKKKLFRFTYVPGMSMNDYVNSFNKILADLLNLDEKFEDEDKALLLLNSLPDEYDHLTTTLLHGKDTITFDAVCITLYRSETRKKDKRDHRDTTAEVLTVRGHSHSNKSGRSGKSKGRPVKDECAFCREKGHWKKNCPKLQKGKTISNACVAEHDEESDFSLVGMAMACHTDEWILDSGCTYHMCPNKDWFFTLKELEDGVVLMGNDSACKTMGVGTVQLKNHDGSIQVLTDVRYVPSLKKNLISLGALESKGLTITLRDGLLKVVARELTVMKGTRRNNLYFLNGSTVIGSISTVSAKDVDSKATRLWHMRLGHAGEKALQTLAKQGLLKGANSCKLEFCEHCVLGKQTRVKFGLAIHNMKEILDYVHSDVWGSTKVASLVDNGTEYKNDPFLQVCQDEGIVRHFTVRDTPQQNGVAERMNWTILEKVRCMSSNAELGKEFWAEAVTYACHLINRLPSAAINEKTPMKMWTDKSTTDYDSLYVFGSTAYYHDSQKDDKTSSALQQVELKKVNDDPANIGGTNDEEVLTEEPLQRPRREIRKPARFDDIVAYALPIADDDVPSTYTEAISNPDGVKWKQAMNEEMQSLHKNRTWELVTLPKGKKTIGCKWVYAKKEGFPGKNKIRYKARSVAKGYAHKEGIDYNEVFSPVAKHSSIRILLALVAQYDLELVQLDVKAAFLHGDLEEKIDMTQPDGFKKLQEGTFIFFLLYVDDMLIVSKSKVEIERLKTQLNLEFEMKDLGEAKKILGMERWKDRAHDRVSLSQKQYLKKVLQQFGMNEHTKPVSTPLASDFKLSVQLSPSTNTEQEYMLQFPYSNAVGSLMYAMDNTLDKCVIGYVDSDYAGDLGKRRSTTDYVFTLAGGPIRWKSALQSTVALSTKEAEYMAVTEAVKEAIWLQGMEIIDEGKICLQKIKTADNPADMMTNVVTVTKFEHCLNLINILQVGRKDWPVTFRLPMNTLSGGPLRKDEIENDSR